MRYMIFVLALCCASGAQAATLAVGDNALPGTTSAAEPQLAGVVLEDDLQTFQIVNSTGTLSGTVQNRVIRSATDGTIDFSWRIRDLSFDGSPAAAAFEVTALRIGGFGSTLFGANGNFRTDGLGDIGPDIARVFANPGGFVNFVFSAGLADNQESLFFFIDTNATTYRKTALYDLSSSDSGAISDIYTTYRPGIPEPSTWAMLITGFGLLGWRLRRRAGAGEAAALAHV